MGKAITYLAILFFYTLCFYLFGIITTSPLLTLLLNPGEVFHEAFWDQFASYLLLGAGIAIAITVASGRTNIVDIVVSIVVTQILVVWAQDFLQILTLMNGYGLIGKVFGLFLIAPLIVLSVLIMIEWFRGKD